MICDYCRNDFPEKELQLSHDVPKYIGGIDKDGRHWLCKKCHDIYERQVMAFMCKDLLESIKIKMRFKAKEFSKRWFNDKSK